VSKPSREFTNDNHDFSQLPWTELGIVLTKIKPTCLDNEKLEKIGG